MSHLNLIKGAAHLHKRRWGLFSHHSILWLKSQRIILFICPQHCPGHRTLWCWQSPGQRYPQSQEANLKYYLPPPNRNLPRTFSTTPWFWFTEWTYEAVQSTFLKGLVPLALPVVPCLSTQLDPTHFTSFCCCCFAVQRNKYQTLSLLSGPEEKKNFFYC